MNITELIVKRKKDKIFKAVGAVADDISRECYAVGGCVRDMMLDRPSVDIDFVSVGNGIELAEAVAQSMGKGTHLSVFRNFGTAQVKRGHMELEFVGARKESYDRRSRNPIVEDGTLTDDLSRRDFTINAMAVRMMRAIRFATQLGFKIFPATLEAIGRNAHRISIITRERIMDELMKIMHSPRPSLGWSLLQQTGLLKLIFPELHALSGVETVKGRGHKDNFLHTLEVLDKVSAKTDDVWLRWSALLHDIAKPVTKRWDNALGWTFHNHNFIGSKMIPRIFRQMKFPMNDRMRYVQKMVELHMRPIALVEEGVTDSAVRRLLHDAGDDITDLMTLCEADITSKNAEKVKRHLENFAAVRRKMEEVEARDHIRNFQPPVDGSEIMTIFGLEPSREVGLLKQAIKDAILDGVIPNERQAAMDYLLRQAAQIGLTPVAPPQGQ